MTVNGNEGNRTSICQITFRYRWNQRFQTKYVYKYTENGVTSAFSPQKNYLLAAHETGAELQFPFGSRYNFGGSYFYKDQCNSMGDEEAYVHRMTVELTCRFPRRGSLSLQCQYSNILFKGDENSAVAYWMMESLSNGNNLVVNSVYQTKLGGNLQLDVSYECRILTGTPVCHLGSLGLRALF